MLSAQLLAVHHKSHVHSKIHLQLLSLLCLLVVWQLQKIPAPFQKCGSWAPQTNASFQDFERWMQHLGKVLHARYPGSCHLRTKVTPSDQPESLFPAFQEL